MANTTPRTDAALVELCVQTHGDKETKEAYHRIMKLVAPELDNRCLEVAKVLSTLKGATISDQNMICYCTIVLESMVLKDITPKPRRMKACDYKDRLTDIDCFDCNHKGIHGEKSGCETECDLGYNCQPVEPDPKEPQP